MTNFNSQHYSTNEIIDHWLMTMQVGDLTSLEHSNLDKKLELEDLWELMDLVWDEMGCDNIALNSEIISSYYQHPIWLLNGYFIEQHELSLQHRNSISDWIVENNLKKVLDFGGGFGTLARMISDKTDKVIIDIYEPYPSKVALSLCQDYPKLQFVSEFGSSYDCLVSTDVLEHVPDPLDLFSKMIAAVKLDGYLLIANHFFPSIKCHLPVTFHFRYSFDQFAQSMGLERMGICQGSHATIYRKISDQPIDWIKIRRMEAFSRKLFPFQEFQNHYLSTLKLRIKSLITLPKKAFSIYF